MKTDRFSGAVRQFLLINLGLILTAVGIVLFKAPNGFAIGGVSGLSIVIARYFPALNLGVIMLGINIALILLGFGFLGRDFGVRTVYSSVALSFYVWAGQELIPLRRPLTGDTMLELVFAIILPAVGSAVVFNQNSSTGGTDIVAKILAQKTHLHVGKSLLAADFLIACSAFPTLGLRPGLYSVLGLLAKGFLIDMVIENLNVSKKIEIITASPRPIRDYILRQIHRDATVSDAEGAYTGQRKQVLTVVVDRRQGIRLRDFVHRTDPHAFVIITNTSEIIGKGFRNTNAL